MKIVIVGAGALGSVLGGYLAQGGADVTLLARTAHAEAIQRHGLRISGMRGERLIRNLRAVADAGEVRSADLLILGVKTYDTPGTLSSLRHLCGHVGAALSIQNGVRKDEELGEAFGKDAVVGAATIVGAAMPGPGLVVHTSEGGTWIGELDGRRSARVEMIADLFRNAGLPIEVRDDIRSVIWCKLNQMAPAAALSCVTRLRLHEVFQDPLLARLFVELSHEVAQVALRLGIPLVDCQGFPVKTLCAQPLDAAAESVMARGRAMQERGMTQVKISTLQDLERGKRTEAEDVIGHVVRLADERGVPVPELALLSRVIRGVEAAQRSMPPPPAVGDRAGK